MADVSILSLITCYKIISIVIGLSSLVMGYKLFSAGIWRYAGDLDAIFGNNKLVLKSAAPGTFFALFGTIIIVVVLLKGLTFDESVAKTNPVLADKVALPSEPPSSGDAK